MILPWRYVKTTTIKSLYIKGNSFNFLLVVCFYLSLTIKNPKILATEKEGKKLTQLFPHLLFILFLRG